MCFGSFIFIFGKFFVFFCVVLYYYFLLFFVFWVFFSFLFGSIENTLSLMVRGVGRDSILVMYFFATFFFFFVFFCSIENTMWFSIDKLI
jgi:hypothetical protein